MYMQDQSVVSAIPHPVHGGSPARIVVCTLSTYTCTCTSYGGGVGGGGGVLGYSTNGTCHLMNSWYTMYISTNKGPFCQC